jgi:hypothetical protein
MLGAFKSVETPIAPLPPLLIMFGKLRPGLSAIDIASKIARRSESGGKVVMSLPMVRTLMMQWK